MVQARESYPLQKTTTRTISIQLYKSFIREHPRGNSLSTTGSDTEKANRSLNINSSFHTTPLVPAIELVIIFELRMIFKERQLTLFDDTKLHSRLHAVGYFFSEYCLLLDDLLNNKFDLTIYL